MGLKIQIDFIGGATVGIRAYIYDDDDALADPTSAKVTITDPDGTDQVSAEDMTKNDTGVYDYFYKTDSDTATGSWSGEVVVVDGEGEEAKTSIATFGFRIK